MKVKPSLLKALEGIDENSFVGQILSIMASGQTIDCLEPLADGEESTEMTPLEKAYLLLAEKCGPLERDLVDTIIGLGSERCTDAKLLMALETCRLNFAATQKFMWNSIKGRLGTGGKLQLKADGQIVKKEVKEE